MGKYDYAPEASEDDYVLMFCHTCQEEYELPEGVTTCPICGMEILEEC